MATEERYIKLTPEELDERLKDAAAEGARHFAEETMKHLTDLDRAARVEAGLITLQDICALYDVTAETVRNWGITSIEYPGRQNLYRVGDLPEQITENGE
jgi:hypothetical protein